MTDADFLSAIAADPDSDEPRLRYAEWLTRRDDPRGEFIRIQCELARPFTEPARAEHLTRRVEELLMRHEQQWAAGVLPFARAHTFHRGLLEHVEIEAGKFLEQAEALFAAAPLRGLTLLEPGRLMQRIAAMPILNRLAWLALSGTSSITRALKALAYSPHLARLKSLTLRHCGIGPAGAWALASGPALGSLTSLDLAMNSLGDEGVIALASSPRLANLTTLDLDTNRIRDGGALALACSPHLTRLLVLNLERNRIGDNGEAALREAPHLKDTAIHLRGNQARPFTGRRGRTRRPQRSAPEPALQLRLPQFIRYREPLFVLRHREPVRAVAFSPDNSVGASACFDGTVRLWDVREGEFLKRAKTQGLNSAVAFAPAGNLLAGGNSRGDLHIWDLDTGRKLHRVQTQRGNVYQVAFSPDSRTVATADHQESVSLWDVKTGERRLLLGGHTGRVWAVAYSPDNLYLASGAEDGTVLLRHAATGMEVRRLDCETKHVSAVAFSPCGRLLATACLSDTYTGRGPGVGGSENAIQLWEVATGNRIARMETVSPHCLAYSPDGWNLVSGDRTGQVTVWGVSTRSALYTLVGHEDAVFGVTISSNSQRLASCGADGRVCVWEMDVEIPF